MMGAITRKKTSNRVCFVSLKNLIQQSVIQMIRNIGCSFLVACPETEDRGQEQEKISFLTYFTGIGRP